MESEKWGVLREEIEVLKTNPRKDVSKLGRALWDLSDEGDPLAVTYCISVLMSVYPLYSAWNILERAISSDAHRRSLMSHFEERTRRFHKNISRLRTAYDRRDFRRIQDAITCINTETMGHSWVVYDDVIPLVLSFYDDLDVPYVAGLCIRYGTPQGQPWQDGWYIAVSSPNVHEIERMELQEVYGGE